MVLGFVDNGSLTKSSSQSECLNTKIGEWNALKLIVDKKCDQCKNVKAYIDNNFVGAFEAHFVTRGFGGVLAENGFNNIAEFRKFDIAPIIPDLSSKYQTI